MNDFTEIVRQLSAFGAESPRLEARLLIAAATNRIPSDIYSNTKLSPTEQQKLQQMLDERLRHKPLDKILGHREFYKADFIVNTDVLSPRPDTEILVEKALQYIPDTARTILDLGTGSGCIIESILLEKPEISGIAADKSVKSLEIAQKNAEKLGLCARIKFVAADWFEPDFTAKIGKKSDIIVTNPPYIPSTDIVSLAPEVKNYDPMWALDGGADGFDSYRRIAELTPDLLTDGGFILIEAGIGQAQAIAELFVRQKLRLVEIASDLNRIPRCVILQK
ncbi:MAG: peptide chain release factor N(5)-glutamine methyltransferase [Alphaproteobacteria bacterium]|nr:peptide chain release factor N(5)-glutamine methyltransferase [Alphaproteobacteria bacterium]